ncbi:uncharacterized protein LOC144497831 isoform X2 [Mustelus asterias]
MEHRFTLWDLPSISSLLLHLSALCLWLPGEAVGRKEAIGVVGSSVLLDPGYGVDLGINDVIWMFNGSNGNPVIILDYLPNYPREEPNEHFRSCLFFNTSNGSLMLNNLKASDQGVYTIIVGGVWKWSTDLKPVQPLSEPFINETNVNGTTKLTCLVSVGEASSILWRKDDKVITNGQHYRLVQSNSTLIISEANCDIYVCTMENRVSTGSSSHILAFYSLSPLHYCTIGLFVATLTTAGPVLSCTIISFLLVSKTKCFLSLQYVLQAWQYLPMLSFLLFAGAMLCWIPVEGLHNTRWMLLLPLCPALISSLLLICKKACDKKRKKLLDTLKIKNKGCEATFYLQTSRILAVVLPIFLLAVLVLSGKTCTKQTDGNNAEAERIQEMTGPSSNPSSKVPLKSDIESGKSVYVEEHCSQ